MTRRICSIEERSGDNPPCMVKIFSSMMAAMGRQLKQSVNVFHSLILYLRLPYTNQYKFGEQSRRGEREWDTFIVKSVDPVDACTFMVSSKNKEVFGVFDFVCEEETYCFQGLFSPIHIIA